MFWKLKPFIQKSEDKIRVIALTLHLKRREVSFTCGWNMDIGDVMAPNDVCKDMQKKMNEDHIFIQ